MGFMELYRVSLEPDRLYGVFQSLIHLSRAATMSAHGQLVGFYSVAVEAPKRQASMELVGPDRASYSDVVMCISSLCSTENV